MKSVDSAPETRQIAQEAARCAWLFNPRPCVGEVAHKMILDA